jgi:poly-gamma-glutamate synthesis protein (capsule biosynthesis protein)
VFDRPDGSRVLVFAAATASSGVLPDWAATPARPGVHRIDETDPATAAALRGLIERYARRQDVVVMSLHWGPNWSYDVPPSHRRLAHALIDDAGVDLVYGHSSHHVKAIEVYDHRPILYGCGDFLTDYEGISGHDTYRDDLGLMYFPRLDPATGRLQRLMMQPTQIRRLRVHRAPEDGVRWIADVLHREGEPFGTSVARTTDDRLGLRSP